MKLLNFKFVTTAVFLLTALLCAGCASQAAQNEAAPEALAGTWVLKYAEMAEDGQPMQGEGVEQYVFDADGNGGFIDDHGETERLTFTVDGNVLSIIEAENEDDVYAFYYELDGDTLILTETREYDPLRLHYVRAETP